MKKQSKNILAIDPSINYLGYALFNKAGKLCKYDLLTTPNYPSSDKKSYVKKSKIIFNIIKKIHDKYNTRIVLEVPEHWSVSGYIARESGAVFKLTFICGMIGSLDPLITVTPTEWKGQIPKHVVGNRLQRVYKDIDFNKLNHNITDSIGIGRYYLFGSV